jgi:hypothetical protein
MRRIFTNLLDFIGGGISRTFGTAIVVVIFFSLFGVTPWEFGVRLVAEPPEWLLNGWLRLAMLILGLTLFAAAFRYNVWSRQQIAIDDLAEDISWAIHNLLNRARENPVADTWVAKWELDFNEWCARVTAKLGNRAFFTRADQLHFDRLGFVPQVAMSGHQRHDWLLSQLRLKFDRLRDVINWTQQRRR